MPDLQLALYNSHDLVATARSWLALRRELKDHGQWSFYRNNVWPMVEVCYQMQSRGLPISESKRTELLERYRGELAENDQILHDTYRRTARCEHESAEAVFGLFQWLFPPPGKAGAKFRRRRAPFTKAQWDKLSKVLTLNPDSDPQMRRWLYEDLALKPTLRTEGGSWSVSQEALLRIYQRLRKKDEPWIPVLHALLHRSRINTILERYMGFEIVNGRAYPIVKVHGAETGRLAYSNPAVQQWPPEIRGMLQAKDGFVLLSGDYSQLEVRIWAVRSRDPIELEVIRTGGDPHAQMAKEAFGYSHDQWDDLTDETRKSARLWAKTFRFGVLMYGGEPDTAKTKVLCPCPKCESRLPENVPRKVMKERSQRWFARHPQAVRYREELVRSVLGRNTSGWYTTAFGRRRKFHGPFEDCKRELLNFDIQPCAAEVMNRAMIRLHHLGAPMIFQNHDELVLECPEAEADRWAPVMKREMERPVPELDNTVFPIDLRRGKSWDSLKSL